MTWEPLQIAAEWILAFILAFVGLTILVGAAETIRQGKYSVSSTGQRSRPYHDADIAFKLLMGGGFLYGAWRLVV